MVQELERRRPRVRTVNEEPSLTVQSDVVRSDIRHVLAKYEATGVLVGMREVDLAFRDVSEFTDYQDLMHQLRTAEAQFMRLPSKVREVFDHDVAKWLDCAHDQEKFDELRPALEELGAVERLEKPQAAPVSPPGAEPSGEASGG